MIGKRMILSLCMLLPIIGFAQLQLKGTVRMEQAGMSKATVSLDSLHQLTDSAGRFIFEDLRPGKYRLTVSIIGSEPFFKNIHLNENRELLVDLQPAVSSMDAIVVSGTMKPVRKLESPVAVEVYTPQFFRKNPAPSIFESLQQVNGVRPQINCSVCNTGDIHINGLEGPYTMVTIDGMPIVSSLSSVYGLFGIPSELIERVEIVKGPASGLYGSEAIGGLINIITKSPEKAPLFSASVMSTSWLEHSVDMGLKWKAGKLQSIVGVNYYHFGHRFDKNDDGFTDVTLQHRVSVFQKWSLQRKSNRTASLAARYFNEDRWGGDMRWNKSFRGGDSIYGESIYTKRWELIGNYQLPLPGKFHAAFSATGHNQNSFYGTTPYMASQHIYFGQLTWQKENKGQHNLLAGLALRYNYYDDNSTATVDTLLHKNKPSRATIPGIFLQDEWKPVEDHRFLFGFRYDHHPSHGPIYTPRLAYQWKINERKTFRLNAGTGFRVVNLFTEDHAALTGARAVEIRSALKPEKSYNVNLNYMVQLGSGSNRFLLDATAWYSYFTNQIIADYTTDPNKIIYDNLDGYAQSRGVSLNIEANIMQRLKGLVGITIQDVSKVEGAKATRQRPLLTESWSGTWSITYTVPVAGLNFDYTGNLYGPMKLPLLSDLDPRQPNSPVWSIQNIQVTKWVSSRVEAFGGIKNLLNWTPAKNNPFIIARTNDPFDKQLDYDGDGKVDVDANGKVLVTPQNPYGLSFDPSYIYAPNQGLRVFAGFRVKIK